MNSMPSGQHPAPSPGPGDEITLKRVLLTVLIIGGAVIFMVLPWAMLFHSPEQYAAWAATGVIMAVAVHLFFTSRKRRQALKEMAGEEDGGDDETGRH